MASSRLPLPPSTKPTTRASSPTKLSSTACTTISSQAQSVLVKVLDQYGNSTERVELWVERLRSSDQQHNETSDNAHENPPAQYEPKPSLIANNSLHLGRMSYNLTNLPKFCILPIDIKAVVGEEKNSIRSQRLRYKAIQEFTQISDLKCFENQLYIKIDKFEHPLDELIVPIRHGRGLPQELEELVSTKLEKVFASTKFHSKAEQEEDGCSKSHEVLCTVLTNHKETIGPDHPKYLRSLDTLIRKNASEVIGTQNNPHSLYGMNVDFFNQTPSKFGHVFDSKRSSEHGALEGLNTIKLKIRHKAHLLLSTENPDQPPSPGSATGEKVPVAVLTLDFDLVPVVHENPVSEVLLELFGRGILGTSMRHNYETIKHILLGLHVRALYDQRADAQSNLIKEKCSGTNDKTPIWDYRKRYTINEIRMPGEIEAFGVKGEGGEMRSYSVNKYFNELILQRGQSLQYQGLPLANVGSKEIGRQKWIPLEMLRVNHPQVLRRFGYFINGNMALSSLKTAVMEKGEQRIRDHAKAFLDDANQGASFFDSSEGLYLPVMEPEKQPKVAQFAAKKVRTTQVKPLSKLHIVYIAPEASSRVTLKTTELLLKGYAKRLLQDRDYPGHGTKAESVNNRLSFDGYEIITTSHWQDLVQTTKPTLAFNRVRKSALLGIVDRTGRDNATVHRIYAELQRFGGRSTGLPTVCTTLQSLQTLISSHKENSLYFPSNVLCKINYMAGGTNYEHQLQELAKSLKNFSLSRDHPNVMVVGAHVSHAGSGGVKHCPSVAAVVASSSTLATHFPGSARLQSRLRKTMQDPAKCNMEYIIENPQIIELQAMMKERFEAWKLSDKPPTVLFYRDGLVYDDPAIQGHSESLEGQDKQANIIIEEMAAIKKAYREVFDTELTKLSYVLVNQNSTKQRTVIRAVATRPRIYFTTEQDDNAAKYMYRVFEDPESTSTPQAFKELTIALNESSQLGQNVSMALPVHFAHKLCKRMYDYIYHFRAGDMNSSPGVIRKAMDRGKNPADYPKKLYEVANANNIHDVVQAYLFGGREKQDTPRDPRVHPWREELDNTMFYL